MFCTPVRCSAERMDPVRDSSARFGAGAPPLLLRIAPAAAAGRRTAAATANAAAWNGPCPLPAPGTAPPAAAMICPLRDLSSASRSCSLPIRVTSRLSQLLVINSPETSLVDPSLGAVAVGGPESPDGGIASVRRTAAETAVDDSVSRPQLCVPQLPNPGIPARCSGSRGEEPPGSTLAANVGMASPGSVDTPMDLVVVVVVLVSCWFMCISDVLVERLGAAGEPPVPMLLLVPWSWWWSCRIPPASLSCERGEDFGDVGGSLVGGVDGLGREVRSPSAPATPLSGSVPPIASL